MLSVLYPLYELLHFVANNIILLTYDWEQLQMYTGTCTHKHIHIHICIYTKTDTQTDTDTEYNDFIPDVRIVLI